MFLRRSVGSDISGVKNTFSSWDACMSKTYCKWPVIAAIIIASLILLSVLFCLARCLCFGMECCCGCFRCCNACCPSPRKKREKYQEPVGNFGKPNYQGYQKQEAPVYDPRPTVPHFAQFDVTKKTPGQNASNADSLPAMPSWDGAVTRRIEDNSHQEVEMDHLHADDQRTPMLAHQPQPHALHESYGQAYSTNTAPSHGPSQGSVSPLEEDGYAYAYAPNHGDNRSFTTAPSTQAPPPQAFAYGGHAQDHRDDFHAGGGSAAHANAEYGVYDPLGRQTVSPPPPSAQYSTPPPHAQYSSPPPPQQQPTVPYGAAAYADPRRARGPSPAFEPQQMPVHASSPSPEPPSPPQAHVSPVGSALPASLMAARGSPRPPPQQQQQGSYTAYAPAGESKYTAYNGGSLPSPRKPLEGSWREV